MNNTSEPSCHIPNGNHYNPPLKTSTSSALFNAPYKQCPVLPPSKCQLLKDNDGCPKCHRVFINNCATNCPNNFLSPVNYKTLMQSDIDCAKCSQNETISAITVSSMSKPPPIMVSDELPTQSTTLKYHIETNGGKLLPPILKPPKVVPEPDNNREPDELSDDDSDDDDDQLYHIG